MLSMLNNPVLVTLAARATRERIAERTVEVERAALEQEYVDEEVARRVWRIKRTLEQRRYRRWDSMLGRRADGHTIRPIPEERHCGSCEAIVRTGRRFRFAPILSSSAIADLREAVRAEVEGKRRSEWCWSGCGRHTCNADASYDGARICAHCVAFLASVEAHSESWYHSFEEWASREAEA